MTINYTKTLVMKDVLAGNIQSITIGITGIDDADPDPETNFGYTDGLVILDPPIPEGNLTKADVDAAEAEFKARLAGSNDAEAQIAAQILAKQDAKPVCSEIDYDNLPAN